MSIAQALFNQISHLYSLTVDQLNCLGLSILIPHLEEKIFSALIEEASQIISQQPQLIHVSAPVYVVGDLHGNLRDLLRIFSLTSSPALSKFIFLGDYIDRGEFSVEVMIILLVAIVNFPQNVIMLRGNHEINSINSKYGFHEQLLKIYGPESKLFEKFNNFFSFLSLSAIIDNKILCLHGGICPNLSISYLQNLTKPIQDPEGIELNILWSDPILTIPDFSPSARGYGCNYGFSAISHFLRNENLELLLRGHECVIRGIEHLFSKKVYTVFSSSNYLDSNNQGGIALIKAQPRIQVKSCTYPPLDPFLRSSTRFFDVTNESLFRLPKSFSKQFSVFPILRPKVYKYSQNVGIRKTNSQIINNNSSPFTRIKKVKSCKINEPLFPKSH